MKTNGQRAMKKAATVSEQPPVEISPKSGTRSGPNNSEEGARYERIAARAYERYEQRGRQERHGLEDWLEAEREIREETIVQAACL